MRGLFFGLALLLTPIAQAQSNAPFDLLLRGGQVYDGTGNPWFYADVGLRDGHIAAVGNLTDASAHRVLDVTGLAVLPGFIDLHSHADDGARRLSSLRHEDERLRAAPNLVMQGVTTVVVNQDGRSPWPIAEQRSQLEALGIGVNTALMVGHATVRRAVLGDNTSRPATADEVQQMQAMIQQAMEEGAWGLSVGLEYTPGRYSTTDEVVALVEAMVPYGGVYIAHQRSEGADPMWFWPSKDAPGAPTLIDAVLETIAIGERTGATVVASHLKAKGAHYWGTSQTVIQLIEAARARGVAIWGDHYPYTTSGTDGNTVLIPRWAYRESGQSDYRRALRMVLADDAQAADLRQDIAHEIRRRGAASNIVVFEYPDSTFIGQSLATLADQHGVDPVEMAIRIQLDGFPTRPGGARLRGFSMSEADVEAYARQPWMATTSDGGIALPGGPPVHPRFYGTFPRKLAYYAKARGVLSLPDAIRSATSLPAQILGLRSRGQVREGFHADLVVVDMDALQDRATAFDPHQYPDGIVHVLLGGTFAVEAGQPTGRLIGQVLTRH